MKRGATEFSLLIEVFGGNLSATSFHSKNEIGRKKTTASVFKSGANSK